MKNKIIKLILLFILFSPNGYSETIKKESLNSNLLTSSIQRHSLFPKNTEYFKYSVNGKCIRLRLVNGKGKKPSRLYLRHGFHSEKLLYKSSENRWKKRYSTLNSIRLVPLEGGGYSVFWMVYTQMTDEVLMMDELNKYGNHIVDDRKYGTYNPGGTKPVIKLLRNQNYLVGYSKRASIRIHLYDNDTGDDINKFSVSIGKPCRIKDLEVMTTNNGGFLVVCKDVVRRFNSDGSANPF